jgi:Acyl-CoA dehydrogenase, C-terminal domain
MIGNHDDRATFREVFSDVPVDPEGFAQSVLDTSEGRMIFLDTVEAGADDGVLYPRRLTWLTQEGQLLHGGWGYAEETPISRYVVDAQVLPIFEGVRPILALKVIARQLLRGAG